MLKYVLNLENRMKLWKVSDIRFENVDGVFLRVSDYKYALTRMKYLGNRMYPKQMLLYSQHIKALLNHIFLVEMAL